MRDINYVTKTLAKRHKNIDEKDIVTSIETINKIIAVLSFKL